MKPRYVMATKAHHRLGDLSREVPDLCIVDSEDEDNYYGHWVDGFRFTHVRFPKATTRPLSESEIARYHGHHIRHSHGLWERISLVAEPRRA